MRNLKETELQRLKNRERLRIRRENKKTEDHKKQHLATLKRLKRCDERNLRLEKVVVSEQLRLAVEREEERRARLEDVAATNRRNI